MTDIQIAAFVCYALGTLVLIGFSVPYLTRSEFMPYQREALGIPWEQVDTRLQVLLIGLMRATGGLALATGLAMLLILLVPYRAGQPWASFALAAIAVAACAFSLSSMRYVKRVTAARPPFASPLAVLAFSGLGFALSLV